LGLEPDGEGEGGEGWGAGYGGGFGEGELEGGGLVHRGVEADVDAVGLLPDVYFTTGEGGVGGLVFCCVDGVVLCVDRVGCLGFRLVACLPWLPVFGCCSKYHVGRETRV